MQPLCSLCSGMTFLYVCCSFCHCTLMQGALSTIQYMYLQQLSVAACILFCHCTTRFWYLPSSALLTVRAPSPAPVASVCRWLVGFWLVAMHRVAVRAHWHAASAVDCPHERLCRSVVYIDHASQRWVVVHMMHPCNASAIPWPCHRAECRRPLTCTTFAVVVFTLHCGTAPYIHACNHMLRGYLMRAT